MHVCTCLGQIYLGWFDTRCHRWYWADGTGLESQPPLPEPHSGRVYCPRAIILFQRLLTSVRGKLCQQGHKLHLILDLRPFAWSAFCSRLPALNLLLGFDTSVPTLPPELYPERKWWCPRSWSLGTPSSQALGNQLHSSLWTDVSNSHIPPVSLGNSLRFVPLLVGSGWFVLHSALLSTLRLETFLWCKLCLGAYRTNNHKLFGSLLHLWLHFLCSQRAERIPCKIQLCCICM